jgi:tRNA threonylcarbamoyladenosine biosynthesis protein TsaB
VTGVSLALSTASPALSLALFDGDRLIAHDHRVIGRGHAEALLPAIATMLAGRPPPDTVLVDIGPGSFTGIRIGIAAARALGMAWAVPVCGFSGAALVAARSFAMRAGLARVGVVLDAGRGQLLFGDFAAGALDAEMRTLAPDDIPQDIALAGAGVRLLPDNAGYDCVHDGQPDAAYALHLPATARSLAPKAHYIRPPDAILPL